MLYNLLHRLDRKKILLLPVAANEKAGAGGGKLIAIFILISWDFVHNN